jgi:hypothetical protein
MPSQKRSLTGRIFRAYEAFCEPLRQEILPLSASTVKVLPTESCFIRGRAHRRGFWPERLTISDAGTTGGAGDWVVNDIKIAGESQFLQSGDIPGDMFAHAAVQDFVRFGAVKASEEVELVVTYIGLNAEGCPFIASLTGTEYDPGPLAIVREALSRALMSASRGFSVRPR